MYACDKTIKQSKEMIITKVRIMATSRREEELYKLRRSPGAGVLGIFHFLTWLIAYMVPSFIITHYIM